MADSIITTLRLIGQRSYVSGMDAAARSTNRLERASREAGDGMSVFQSRLGGVRGMAGIAGSALKGLGLAVGAVTLAVGKMGIEFNAKMQQSTIGFQTLLKGSKKAGNAMAKTVTKYALKSPILSIADSLQSTQQMLGAGMNPKRATSTLKAFSDTLSAMGRGPEDLKRMTYAFSQMLSKGQISAEELRGQLGEIFPASRILADKLGMTTGQLAAEMKSGSLKGKKYVYALLDATEAKYKGATERQAKTFNGMFNNIKENAKYTAGLLTKGLFDVLSNKVLPKVQDIQEGIQKWAKGGGINRATGTLKQAFKSKTSDVTTTGPVDKVMATIGGAAGKVWPVMAKAAKDFVAAIKPAMPFIQNVLMPFALGFAKGLIAGLLSLIPLIKIVATVLGWIGTKAAPLKGIIEGIGFVIGFVFGPAKLGIFARFGKIVEFVGSKIGALWKWLGRVSDIIAWVSLRFGQAGGAIGRFASNAAGKIAGIVPRIARVGGDILKAIINGIKGLGKAIGAVISDAAGSVLSAAISLGAAIWDGIKQGLVSLIPGGKAGELIKNVLGMGVERHGRQRAILRAHHGTRSRAHGGLASGMTLVGEQGPELMHVPGPGMISPIGSMANPNLSNALSVSLNAPIYLDRRQIGGAVIEDWSDRQARR